MRQRKRMSTVDTIAVLKHMLIGLERFNLTPEERIQKFSCIPDAAKELKEMYKSAIREAIELIENKE